MVESFDHDSCTWDSRDFFSDLAAEHPLYIYISADKAFLYIGTNLAEMLEACRKNQKLEVSDDAISYLLQSGCVPTPLTVFTGLYVVSIGIAATILRDAQGFSISFNNEYPFGSDFYTDRQKPIDDINKEMLELIACRVDDESVPNRPKILFHSAGKDSNTVALALSGLPDKSDYRFVSIKADDAKDESEISRNLAKKMGFEHKVLNPIDTLGRQESYRRFVTEFFRNAPFPGVDFVSIVYPLLLDQYPDLRGANIIDGGGNDAYMTIPVSQKEKLKLKLGMASSVLHPILKYFDFGTLFTALTRSAPEWCGMSGFGYRASSKILPGSIDCRKSWIDDWKTQDSKDKSKLYTKYRAGIIAAEVHLRKVRNFGDAFGCKVIFPFANEAVVNSVRQLSYSDVTDIDTPRNKVFLRNLLKEKLDLDSDALGKLGFEYDVAGFLIANRDWVEEEIMSCTLWNTPEVSKATSKLYAQLARDGWVSRNAAAMLNRLFLISGWYRHCKFIQ